MYDLESGLVFREWTVPRRGIPSRSELDWFRRRPYPVFTPRGSRGPRSLVSMATNIIANNIGAMSEEHLEGLPTRLWWGVWRFLEARGVCLQAWKLLSHLLLQENHDKNLGLYRFREHICRPQLTLKQYIQPLTSLKPDFVTHLVITGGCSFSINDLLPLAEMSNLGILELIQPADELQLAFSRVTDRLLRGWSEKDNPFPLLRVLRVFVDEATTQESLQWVSRFPSLALYDVMGARADWSTVYQCAATYGWLVAEPMSGLEDSLLRCLMLFAPTNETSINRLRELSRNIDTDLVSLCSDSRCAMKFVKRGEAPPLLNYLHDSAKINMPPWDADAASKQARACKGVAFEAWGFWLYSFIGQLCRDDDLRRNGISCEVQAVAGPFVLPSKPMACLYLGHSGRGGISPQPSYISKGLFSTKRYTFSRHSSAPNLFKEVQECHTNLTPDRVDDRRTHLVLKEAKKRRLDEVLQSLES